MKDKIKTKEQLIKESEKLRQHNAHLKASESNHKKAEKLLKESEEKYRLLVETSIDMIFTVDLEGNFLFTNKAFEKNLGYSKEEIKKTNGLNLVHPDDLLSVRNQFAQLLEGKNASNMEYRYKTKYGSYIHILNNASPIFDSQGNVVAAFGVARDITLRKKMEEELQKAHNELEQRVKKRTTELLAVNKKLKQEIKERRKGEKVKASVYKISEAAHSAENLEELYRIIHRTISDLMPAKNNFYIALYDPETDMLDFPYFVDEFEDNPGPQKLGKGLTEYVLRTGKPLLTSPEIFIKLEKKGEVVSVGPPSIDWLGVPLNTKERTIGVLTVQSYTEGIRYSEEDKNILTFISEQVAMAIERKQVEEALKVEESYFEQLFESAAEAIVMNTNEGKVLNVNNEFLRLFRYRREEAIGELLDNLVVPQKLMEEGISLTKRVAKGEKVYIETVRRRKDGSLIHVSILGAPIKIRGKQVAVYSIYRDITEGKRAEEQLRDSEEKYKNIVELSPDGIVTIDLKGFVTSCNTSFLKLTGYTREEIVNKHFTKLPTLRVQDIPQYIKTFNSLVLGRLPKPFEFIWNSKEGNPRVGDIRVSFMKKRGKTIGFQAVVRDITERKKAEEKTMTALKEKEVLLQEIHHRVKNNMQIISSLINLQSRHIEDRHAQEMFKETKDRVRSMALVHEKLYRSEDLARIDFAYYTRGLITHLFHSYKVDPNAIHMKTEIGEHHFDINTAIPCGLLINELISNSLKHAFPDDARGEISVELKKDKRGKHKLIVKDTGIGFPEGLDFRKTETLGMQIVTDLAKQIKGSIKLDRKNGTKFTITF